MPPVPQEPAPVLSTAPPTDVSTFLAFPSPEKLLRLGPKSSVLIAQQVGDSAANSKPAGAAASGAAGGQAEHGLGAAAVDGSGGLTGVCVCFSCRHRI